MTEVMIVSPGTINFEFLIARSGGRGGARDEFENLVVDIVHLKHPQVRGIGANPGDWGIDGFVGDMAGGDVAVWQSKFFIDGVGETQKGEIRDSFTSARTHAEANGYRLTHWTLCIPVTIDAPTNKWWQGWALRQQRKYDIVIDLWDAGQLRRRLQGLDEDSKQVREHYFNPMFTVPDTASSGLGQDVAAGRRTWRELEDDARFSDSLFVKQMHEARLTQTRQAREAFFNAEILEQEVADKGIAAEATALTNWRARVGAVWSACFNDATARYDGPQLPGLYLNVLDRIEARHATEASSLRAEVIHGHGLMHQHVDRGAAGWVRHWETIAGEHAREFIDGLTDDAVPASTPGAVGGPGDAEAPEQAAIAEAATITAPAAAGTVESPEGGQA